MRLIEIKREDTYGEIHRSLINIDSIVSVSEDRNIFGHDVAFIHLNDGATFETDMSYIEFISLIGKAVEEDGILLR